MYVDLFFVFRLAYLVTHVEPLGFTMSSFLLRTDVKALRRAIGVHLGYLHQRGARVTSLHSDNEKGITALAMDFAGMGIQLIQVGAGMHVPIIERRIRMIKEGTRGILAGLPYTPPTAIFLHLPIWVTMRMSAFRSTTRPDDATPFTIIHGHPFNAGIDARYKWGSLHYVTGRETDNSMTPRATACIAIGQVHNGTGIGMSYSLATGHVMRANHTMPFSTEVLTFLNSLSAKDPRITSREPAFRFHGDRKSTRLNSSHRR